jgi:hypothetical protein
MDQEQIKKHELAQAAILEQATALYHNYNVMVRVEYTALAKLGILEAYLLLRGIESIGAREYDYVTLGQAKSLGLIA